MTDLSSDLVTPRSVTGRSLIRALALLGSLLLLGCGQKPAPHRAAATHGEAAGAPAKSPHTAESTAASSAQAHSTYVGSAACGECHQAEYQKWFGSHHAETMRAMNAADLGPLAPPVGVIPKTPFEITRDTAGHFTARLASDPDKMIPLALAMGSGKVGLTYVSIRHGLVLEFHESYFPNKKSWYTTPGSERIPRLSPGLEHNLTMSRKCLLCHATALTGPDITPQPKFFGVGCERCHGPGSAHVAAMRAGNYQNLLMDDITKWNATRINTLCGQCHRTAADINLASMDAASTNRFQPYGLMLSRCFRESGNALSCITCHDPHTNNSSDIRRYERACLQCHSPAGSRPPAPGAPVTAAHTGKVCPVNPNNGCISCHMPRREALQGNHLPATMPDHWIRIFKIHSP